LQNLALRGLAYFYLERADAFEKALDPLEDLANLPEGDLYFRAFGTAGLVIAYTNLGRWEEASQQRGLLTEEMETELRTRDASRMSARLDQAIKALEQLGLLF
jgi:hypothetical protein